MKKEVILSICGKQTYMDQEPDVIELVTEGTLEKTEEGWELYYEESDLTGLQGVNTCFCIGKNSILLERSGRLSSQMYFEVGVSHDSLYQVEFGALMITVCATRVDARITDEGGTVDLVYNIEIEHSAAGVIDYHLEIRNK